MKKELKYILPDTFLEKLKQIRNYGRSLYLFKLDKKRFLQNYSKKNFVNEEQLKARLIFYSHSVEKGLARENFRYYFGKNVIPELYRLVKLYKKSNYDTYNSIYLNAVSVLNQYISVHEEKRYDVKPIINVQEFKEFYLNHNFKIGGAKQLSCVDVNKNYRKNFKNLALERNSVRDYQNSSVDLKKINEAVEIALKTPSVCNRQSSRVRIIQDKTIIEKALKIQGGFNGYTCPPCLIMITTDTNYFIDVTERNQIYIDGGLFAMSLLYALEYEGLAACALNTMFDIKRDKKTRKLLDIPDSENLILYITVGNFKKNYKVPMSHRLCVNEITSYI
ncbi:nitroreductase family protein [Enterococcus sp. DIV0660C]|uniref:nitroreductase family protein n=1 Tax=Enterococcus sp. DIV0660C TaxID=2230880 RepID=UPI001A8C608D|nr:nitroreductase family protein [Enterococcus sp. DIV0660C]MBO0432878.1 nitroreductase family protein [Enterococcus sp. DIV0660C]